MVALIESLGPDLLSIVFGSIEAMRLESKVGSWRSWSFSVCRCKFPTAQTVNELCGYGRSGSELVWPVCVCIAVKGDSVDEGAREERVVIFQKEIRQQLTSTQ